VSTSIPQSPQTNLTRILLHCAVTRCAMLENSRHGTSDPSEAEKQTQRARHEFERTMMMMMMMAKTNESLRGAEKQELVTSTPLDSGVSHEEQNSETGGGPPWEGRGVTYPSSSVPVRRCLVHPVCCRVPNFWPLPLRLVELMYDVSPLSPPPPISRQSIAIAGFVRGRPSRCHRAFKARSPSQSSATDLTVVVGQQAPAPGPSFGGHPPSFSSRRTR